MNKYKIKISMMLAVLVAFTMLAVPFASMGSSENIDDAPALSTNASIAPPGKFNIYVYDSTETSPTWESDIGVQASDGYRAVVASKYQIYETNSSLATQTTSNSSQTIGITSNGYTYYYPNPEYGDFSAFNTIPNDQTNQWYVYVYDNSSNNESNHVWRLATNDLGWYRPYADYAAVVDSAGNTCATANIAFVYGSNITTMPSIASYAVKGGAYELRSLTSISETSTFEYHFYLQANTGFGAEIAPNTSVKVLNADGTYSSDVTFILCI